MLWPIHVFFYAVRCGVVHGRSASGVDGRLIALAQSFSNDFCIEALSLADAVLEITCYFL